MPQGTRSPFLNLFNPTGYRFAVQSFSGHRSAGFNYKKEKGRK